MTTENLITTAESGEFLLQRAREALINFEVYRKLIQNAVLFSHDQFVELDAIDNVIKNTNQE